MRFKIIDKTTGKEPTRRVITNIAKKNGLMEMDIDQFFIGEDGQLVLTDDCGRMAYLDGERFKAVFDGYEYHYNHTDCIWHTDNRSRCPDTCSQYRDGWNDAMQYIFMNGKGYSPYVRK